MSEWSVEACVTYSSGMTNEEEKKNNLWRNSRRCVRTLIGKKRWISISSSFVPFFSGWDTYQSTRFFPPQKCLYFSTLLTLGTMISLSSTLLKKKKEKGRRRENYFPGTRRRRPSRLSQTRKVIFIGKQKTLSLSLLPSPRHKKRQYGRIYI